jgi:hypothetical protein
MFRVTLTIGLVLAAVWMFLEGREFSGPSHELPAWLIGVPPWVLGFVLLVAAVVAAVVPTETVEELVERLLSHRMGRDDGDHRR